MSRPVAERQLSKERTREALTAAARELFAAHGYLATTVDDIANRAGYTKGAFYGHFKDKGDAFNTVLDEHAENTFTALNQVLDRSDVNDVFDVFLTWFGDNFLRNPLQRAETEFYATAGNDDEATTRLGARLTAIRDAIVRMLDNYCDAAQAQLPIPTAEMAAMIMAYVDGISRLQRLPVPHLPPTLLADGLTYLWIGANTSSAE